MRILALDMATRTGWAVSFNPGEPIQSGGKVYMNGKRTLCLEERLCQFRQDLTVLLDTYMPDVACYEIAHHRGGPATRSGIGMETVLIMESYMRAVPCLGVHSLSLKKFCTGSGKSVKTAGGVTDKSPMMNHASKLAGRRITDDNEADAICITDWGNGNVVMNEFGRVSLANNVTKTNRKGRK